MYRLLAIAKYDERYVIPPAHAEQAHSLEELATECSVSEYGGGQQDLFGEGSGAPTPIAVENFQMLQDRQTSDSLAGPEQQEGPRQPAQLGRQGLPARDVPADGRRLMSGRRPRPTLPPDAAHHRLAVGLAAARLPRRGPARPAPTCSGRRRSGCRRLSGTPSGPSWTTSSRRPLPELQADYVETFDTRRRCNLFLTYFAHGDTRKRGMALLRFKQTYLRVRVRARRRRAARPPLRRARVRRHRRPGRRPRPDARPPRRTRAAAALAARHGLAVGAA